MPLPEPPASAGGWQLFQSAAHAAPPDSAAPHQPAALCELAARPLPAPAMHARLNSTLTSLLQQQQAYQAAQGLGSPWYCAGSGTPGQPQHAAQQAPRPDPAPSNSVLGGSRRSAFQRLSPRGPQQAQHVAPTAAAPAAMPLDPTWPPGAAGTGVAATNTAQALSGLPTSWSMPPYELAPQLAQQWASMAAHNEPLSFQRAATALPSQLSTAAYELDRGFSLPVDLARLGMQQMAAQAPQGGSPSARLMRGLEASRLPGPLAGAGPEPAGASSNRQLLHAFAAGVRTAQQLQRVRSQPSLQLPPGNGQQQLASQVQQLPPAQRKQVQKLLLMQLLRDRCQKLLQPDSDAGSRLRAGPVQGGSAPGRPGP